ncbi:MAG TPA: hypothetical protein DD795_05775, partial [Erythrobacter sp.]|nr:hypothetical protein [Erythrobacter sp.]
MARARIDGQPQDAAGDTPTPAATLASQVESACRSIIFEDTPLTHCLAVPERHQISTALDRGGSRYGSLARYADANDGDTIAFAMNAGIFGEGERPAGYFVEDSERLGELDTGSGSGNFYMKPV